MLGNVISAMFLLIHHTLGFEWVSYLASKLYDNSSGIPLYVCNKKQDYISCFKLLVFVGHLNILNSLCTIS